MKMKKISALVLSAVMTFSMAACSDSTNPASSTTPSGTTTAGGSSETPSGDGGSESLGYTYGDGVTFYSEEPVTYSMMYSDHENYPYQADWPFWEELTKRTNVTLDLNIIARADYDDKKSLLINSGQSSYIIPKTYDEGPFTTGGAVVPVSEWVQYMPNYTGFVEKYNLQADLATIVKDDGKYYRLPGMWEDPKSDYTFVIRKDVFDAAGVDVPSIEKDWTWKEFGEALEKVAAANPGKPVWSDKWKGDALLQMVANTYGVQGGWSLLTGVEYNWDKDELIFTQTTEDYKDMITFLNDMVKKGILDPETFTQEDSQAEAKFYNGDSFVIGTNESLSGTYIQNMNTTVGEGNYELYTVILPKAPGKEGYQLNYNRLENGVMIATKALNELGEADFIKMMRFVDWLFYSAEADEFIKWGIEGVTYTVENGQKKLLDDIGYSSMNPDAPKKLNIDFGFSNGMFMYGGTTENRVSMLAENLQDYYKRLSDYRAIRPIPPTVTFSEIDQETLNLIKTPLLDYVKTTTNQFIIGQKDIATGWDEYVATCSANNVEKYVQMYNDQYQAQKS